MVPINEESQSETTGGEDDQIRFRGPLFAGFVAFLTACCGAVVSALTLAGVGLYFIGMSFMSDSSEAGRLPGWVDRFGPDILRAIIPLIALASGVIGYRLASGPERPDKYTFIGNATLVLGSAAAGLLLGLVSNIVAQIAGLVGSSEVVTIVFAEVGTFAGGVSAANTLALRARTLRGANRDS